MKEDFERNQYLTYYSKWRNGYFQFNNTIPSKKPAYYLDEVCESQYSYKTTWYRNTIDPLSITDHSLSSSLAIAFEQTHILLNAKSFYIKDIRDVQETPFNTIVFQLDEPPLKTKEESRTIMNRYFSQKPLDYTYIQHIGKSLGFHHRCPFVSGDEIFVPEKGAANDSTSWYGLHHILSAVEDKKENCMQVTFRNHHELQLIVSAHSFYDQVERSAVLTHLLHAVVDELLSNYGHTLAPYFSQELNVVQRRLKNPTFTSVFFSLNKVMVFLSNYKAQDILVKVLGEENPYLDEVRDHFRSTLTNNPTFSKD